MTYRIVAEFRMKHRKSMLAAHELLNTIAGLEYLTICRRKTHDHSWKKTIRSEKGQRS